MRSIVLLGLFTAMAGILHTLETWLPAPLPLPGAKLGLANIITLLTLHFWGWRQALAVVLARVALGGLLGGTVFGPAFIMSVAAALVSLPIMAFAHRNLMPPFSLIGVSVIGAVAHNTAQVVAAALLVDSLGLFWYLPYLLLAAAPTGLAVGLTAAYLVARSGVVSTIMGKK